MGLGVRWQSHSLPLVGLLSLLLSGCVATRGWVTAQLTPLADRVAQSEGRLGAVEGRADKLEQRLQETETEVTGLKARLEHLRVERRFVLQLQEGAQFAVNAETLSMEARAAIDGFLADVPELQQAMFVVVGHTDSQGPEAYNDELGQRRATSVARYLLTKGVDPLRVTAVSYGERLPVADNGTEEGRRKNRRVEILVYKEVIRSNGGEAPSSPPQARQQN